MQVIFASKIDENYSEIWDKTISTFKGQVEMIRSSLDLLRESQSQE